MSNALTDGNQTINNTMTFNNLLCDALTVTNLNISGFVNGLNVTEMFNDVVTTDTPSHISSHKTLMSLTIENLKVKNNPDFIKQMKSLRKYNVKVEGDMYIENEVRVKNIHFIDSFNGVKKDNFTLNESHENGSHLVHGSQEFDSIKVFGRVFVGSNVINGVNLTDFEDNTIKIDEPFEFETVTFSKCL